MPLPLLADLLGEAAAEEPDREAYVHEGQPATFAWVDLRLGPREQARIVARTQPTVTVVGDGARVPEDGARVPEDGARDTLRAWWTSRIAGGKAPEHVAVDELRVTPMGKVDKPALVAQWEAGGHR